MTEELLTLQQDIFEYHNTAEYSYNLEYSPRIHFSKIGEYYEILFYGEGYDDTPSIPAKELEPEEFNYGFCAFQDFLIENAEKISSIIVTGPDQGANGTRSWNFSRIINAKVMFPNLVQFKVALTEIGDHNQSVIGEYDEEEGMIAKLVSKMPNLKVLQMPSAPDRSFFQLANLSIVKLIIQAGYAHQNFIENLANATNLKQLTSLDYTDVIDHFGDLDESEFTPYKAYEQLFESKLFSQYEHFHLKLRDTRVTEEQLIELQKIKNIQLLHIRPEAAKYIRVK